MHITVNYKIKLALHSLQEMTLWLVRWINDTWLPSSKPLAGSMKDSGLHHSEVIKMSTTNF